MKVVIGAKQVGILHRLVGTFIPGIEKLELNQPTAVQGILKRLGETNVNMAKKVDAVFRDYVIHIESKDGNLIAYLRGVSLEGCPCHCILAWKDESGKSDNGHVAFDPHGLGLGEEAKDLEISWDPDKEEGLLTYAYRSTPEGSIKIRRLKTAKAEEALLSLKKELKEDREICNHDYSTQAEFVSTLCSVSVAGMGDEGKECAIERSEDSTLGYWILKEKPNNPPESYGFLLLEGDSPLDGSVEETLITRGVLRTMKATFAGMSNMKSKLSEVKLSETGLCSTALFSLDGTKIRVSIRREVGIEKTGKILDYLSAVKNQLDKIDFGDPGEKQDLTRLSNALTLAGAWATARMKTTPFSAVRMMLKSNAVKSEVITLVQERERTSIFRLGDKVKGDYENFVFSSDFLSVIQGQLRGWSQQQSAKSENIRFFETKATRAMTVGDKEMRMGCLIRKHSEAELLTQEVLIQPEKASAEFEVSASDLAAAVENTTRLINLPGVIPLGARAFGQLETDLAIMTIKDGQLFIDAGSEPTRIGATASISINRVDNFAKDGFEEGKFYSFGITSRQFLALSKQLAQMIRYHEPVTDLKVNIRMIAKNLKGHMIPTFEVMLKDERVMLCGFRQCLVRTNEIQNNDMGSWQTKPLKKEAVVDSIDKAPLSMLVSVASSFCLSAEEAKSKNNPAVDALQGIYYEADGDNSRVLASNMHQAIEVCLPSDTFGEDTLLLTPGFMQAADHIAKARGQVSHSTSGKRTCILDDDKSVLRLQWHEVVRDSSKFPAEKMSQILENPWSWPDKVPKNLPFTEIGIASGTLVPKATAGNWEAMIKRVAGPAALYEHAIFVIREEEIVLVPRSLLQTSSDMEGLARLIRSKFNKGIELSNLQVDPAYKNKSLVIGFSANSLIKMTQTAREICDSEICKTGNSKQALVVDWELTPFGIKMSQKDRWKMILRPISLSSEEKDLLEPFIKSLEEK